jgi:NTP pyrophosphatase (non-canonical NTP hydrolase)
MATMLEFQKTVQRIYGVPNDRQYSIWDLASNCERFAMRALKGIRKKDREKLRKNLLISMSWFVSIMNRMHIDLEDAVWRRFPHACSYCGKKPCACNETKPEKRMHIEPLGNKPISIGDIQNMFREIYPPSTRTLEHAGIHMAEEMGEFSEAMHKFFGEHKEEHFKELASEAADFISCIMSVANSADIDVNSGLEEMFSNNCHICHNAPCICNFSFVSGFRS